MLRPRIQDLRWRDRGIDEDAYDHVRIEDDTHHAGHWFRVNRSMLKRADGAAKRRELGEMDFGGLDEG